MEDTKNHAIFEIRLLRIRAYGVHEAARHVTDISSDMCHRPDDRPVHPSTGCERPFSPKGSIISAFPSAPQNKHRGKVSQEKEGGHLRHTSPVNAQHAQQAVVPVERSPPARAFVGHILDASHRQMRGQPVRPIILR